MGTNTLSSITSGIIRVAHPNQYFTALSGTVVPRSSLGAPADDNSDLGSSTYRWKYGFFSNLVKVGSLQIGDVSYNNSIYNLSTAMTFRTNAVDRMFITAAGKIGVLSSPQGIFHVVSDAGTAIAPSANGNGIVSQTTTGPAGISIIAPDGSTSNLFFGRATSVGAGKIEYTHVTDSFYLKNNDTYSAAFKLGNFSFTDNATYINTTDVGIVCNNGIALNLLDSTNVSNFALYNSSGELFFRDKNSSTMAKFSFLSSTTNPVAQFLSTGTVASTPTFDFQNTNASVNAAHYLMSVRYLGDNDLTGATYIVFADGNNVTGSITAATATTVAYNTTSDKRLKTDIKDFNGIEILKKISPVNFKWSKSGVLDYGFIAQDLHKIIPQVVNKPAIDKHENGDYKGKIVPWSVDYGKLTPFLAKAVKELIEKNESLEKRLSVLEEK